MTKQLKYIVSIIMFILSIVILQIDGLDVFIKAYVWMVGTIGFLLFINTLFDD